MGLDLSSAFGTIESPMQAGIIFDPPFVPRPVATEAPTDKFGRSTVRYDINTMPQGIPLAGVLEAANALNEYRFARLTHKQRVFVDSYLSNSLDSTIAAVEAGFGQEEAGRVGRKMLKQKSIKHAIDLALAYYTERSKVRFDEVVDVLKSVVFTPITDFVDPATGIAKDEIGDDDPRWLAVKRVSREPNRYGEKVVYEMHDKHSAIEKLIKLYKLDGDAAQPAPTTTNVNVEFNQSVQSISITPVPTGQFLPAPQSPLQQLTVTDAGPILDLVPVLPTSAP